MIISHILWYSIIYDIPLIFHNSMIIIIIPYIIPKKNINQPGSWTLQTSAIHRGPPKLGGGPWTERSWAVEVRPKIWKPCGQVDLDASLPTRELAQGETWKKISTEIPVKDFFEANFYGRTKIHFNDDYDILWWMSLVHEKSIYVHCHFPIIRSWNVTSPRNNQLKHVKTMV